MLLPIVLLAVEACSFKVAFQRPDENGTRKVPVYAAKAEPQSGGIEPLAFVSSLKVNTDGTRISYKADDPRAVNGAINHIQNAMRSGARLADFERLAANNWEPVEETWKVLSSSVIEKDTKLRKDNKPCMTSDKFLVSKTADVAVAGGFNRDGDCDQTKWIDALTIPALVVPGGSEFQARHARTRSFVVAMTLGSPRRIAFGIIGDTGPANEIGEASVEMNRMLNGLPAGSVPANRKDAVARFQGPKSIVLIFPGPGNRLAQPITPERVLREVKARFDAWGGEARLTGCLAEIPEAQ